MSWGKIGIVFTDGKNSGTLLETFLLSPGYWGLQFEVYSFLYFVLVDRLQRSGRLVWNTDVYAKIATIVTVNSWQTTLSFFGSLFLLILQKKSHNSLFYISAEQNIEEKKLVMIKVLD